MKYKKTVRAAFESRPNRFIANVNLDGKSEAVHVKNTGRCRELLFAGADVVLERSANGGRKTRYDLVAVWKESVGWVNIDSQAPNKVVFEWLSGQDYTIIKPEYSYGDSRLDFYMEKDDRKYLMEVKGCTLEADGIGYFPDAPTQRGIKHLDELAKAAGEGYHCIVAFVIQMENVYEVRPNVDTHPEFALALERARAAGVEVWFLPCRVSGDFIEINQERIFDMELWDIYDKNKQRTGRTMKRNDWCLADDEYHLTVLGVIARPDGRFLITKRVKTKAWAPGWWEVSGGAAMAGEESQDAVRREILEETGLDVDGWEGGYLFTYHRENPGEGDNYFVDVYRFVSDFDESELKLQDRETDGYMLASHEEIKAFAEEGIFLHYDSIKEAFEL